MSERSVRALYLWIAALVVTVDQITYLKCGDNWYNRVMQGGSVNYVVVAAPPGF